MPTRNDELIRDLRRRLLESEPVARAIPSIGERPIAIASASLEARALIAAALAEACAPRLAIIVPGDSVLQDFEAALHLFHPNPSAVVSFPATALSPYQEVPPSLSVARDEIRALESLATGTAEAMIVPARALFRLLPLPENLRDRILQIITGDEIDLHATMARLSSNGFARVDLVGDPGEFAFRGGILDIFPPGSDRPVRLELVGDFVESIRSFDFESQRSEEALDAITIAPVSPFALDKPMRTALARRLSLDFSDLHFKRDLVQKIDHLTEGSGFPGWENYLPVATPTMTFFDCFAMDPRGPWTIAVLEPAEVRATIERYEALLLNEFEASAEKGRAVYHPEKILLDADSIRDALGRNTVELSALHVESRGVTQHVLTTHASERYINRLSALADDLTGERAPKQCAVFVASKGGHEKIGRLFKELTIPFADNPPQLSNDIAIADGSLARGFRIDLLDLNVYSEWDLFEPPTSTRVGTKRRAADAFMTSLRDLKAGDFIVHVDHGIGCFRGLQRIAFGENEREVMEIEYSSGGKLLMPMESLHLIQKYSGGEDAQPKLDKLGGTAWARTKASVSKAMRDMTNELLELYATRQTIEGHSFSKDSPWQFEFEEAFEFDETEDQRMAIDDVKSDMESRRPMDRLLCGDVGYGKTEVAMRAAFKSVMDGRQVAVLTPTTILAYQHYRTFLRRFASFPVVVELLSRFRSPKEQKEIVRRVEAGEIDIIVGTHRILAKDLAFRELGLVVIDEEQRFGVAQKERLKQVRKSIDVLSMSATPIPRTLNMSISGIRDISVIETPPKDRLAIQTAVVPSRDDFIREAIEFEIARGGQVFFVHNRVESIYAMKEYLTNLIPGLRVIVGHGQMDEKELERAMMSFIGRDFDVLLATTIIENGIDIPTCNTILINHAERFGLAQLYQLRGRVGRSDRLAFCYLLVPSDKTLSSDARKRLAAIQEFSDLGAGFRIAARDLEIRGSGNILGGEQSGQIATVGFEMYCKLLEDAVREIKGERIEEVAETSLSLNLDVYIPAEYIEDENLRMMFYKRIASARDDARLADIRNEMRDRFGALPAGVENLFQLIPLRHLAQSCGVVSIVRDQSRAVMRFRPDARIDPAKLMLLLERDPQAKFSPGGALTLAAGGEAAEVLTYLHGTLEGLAVEASS